ncbi:MAG: TetR/AcrR family transcriptional regulator [Desulfobacterales bacterium]|jgi:AcrR family transcriptional regulator|nr:hypothetical protein [Desulfobacter sp.]MDP6683938.1 TetR/AcrR family transcriptional regulator [Desulfobacterales bacterium]MDP6808649.1 TetR/AcrR family transcriptional regulator [Desulfobacterales bacterium]|tara:strand:+ start:14297 stop:14851 length:555 start_codon:yes stop_codon:yes gene_type:complete
MENVQINKEKLIQVATNLFASKGFSGTSIRDIANAMNMSISNIYHYFGNKEGLLLEILQHSAILLRRKLCQTSDPNLEPLERFKRLLNSHLQHSVEGSAVSTYFNILGVINWALRWYRPDGKLNLEETTEEVVSFILYGALGGDSSTKESRQRITPIRPSSVLIVFQNKFGLRGGKGHGLHDRY